MTLAATALVQLGLHGGLPQKLMMKREEKDTGRKGKDNIHLCQIGNQLKMCAVMSWYLCKDKYQDIIAVFMKVFYVLVLGSFLLFKSTVLCSLHLVSFCSLQRPATDRQINRRVYFTSAVIIC